MTVQRTALSSFNLFEQRDARGTTPLLLALHSYTAPTSLSLISFILGVAPNTSAVPDEHGVLPILCATQLHMPDDIVRTMLAHDMPIELGLVTQDVGNTYEGNIVHRVHHHSWWHVSANCEDRYLNMIREFLLKSATLLQTLALVQQVGPDGSSILVDAASLTFRHMLRSLLTLYNRYEIQMSIISGYAPFTLLALDHGVIKRNECRKVSSHVNISNSNSIMAHIHRLLFHIVGFITMLLP